MDTTQLLSVAVPLTISILTFLVGRRESGKKADQDYVARMEVRLRAAEESLKLCIETRSRYETDRALLMTRISDLEAETTKLEATIAAPEPKE